MPFLSRYEYKLVIKLPSSSKTNFKQVLEFIVLFFYKVDFLIPEQNIKGHLFDRKCSEYIDIDVNEIKFWN